MACRRCPASGQRPNDPGRHRSESKRITSAPKLRQAHPTSRRGRQKRPSPLDDREHPKGSPALRPHAISTGGQPPSMDGPRLHRPARPLRGDEHPLPLRSPAIRERLQLPRPLILGPAKPSTLFDFGRYGRTKTARPTDRIRREGSVQATGSDGEAPNPDHVPRRTQTTAWPLPPRSRRIGRGLAPLEASSGAQRGARRFHRRRPGLQRPELPRRSPRQHPRAGVTPGASRPPVGRTRS